METNTFTTTVYAEVPMTRAFAYLRRLQNLDEWTLGSRMRTRIDDDTYMGTASGYQTMLCYHVRTLEHPRLAAIEMARELLAHRETLAQWAPLFRAANAATGAFHDEYGRRVQVEFTACELGDYVLVEQDYAYPDLGALQRCPIVLIPCARAFGPEAPGFLLHRVAFVRKDGSQTHGRTAPSELSAESMAIKRILEARAGNLSSFARGMSYRPGPRTSED